MGDASRQHLIPPAGPSMAPTDEDFGSQLSLIQVALIRNWEYKERALKAKVDELQKALDSVNAKESKRKAEMEETKKWVVEELKLLLLNEDSKNGIELLKEKLKNAEVVMDNGFWKRAEYRRVIREQKLKISVLETTLEETESGLRKELQVKHDEVQGLQRRLELAQQKTRDYLRQVLLEMEGNANLDSEVLVAEGENSEESEDQGQNLGRDERDLGMGCSYNMVVAIVTKSTAVSLPVGVQDRSSTDGRYQCRMCTKRFFHLTVCLKHMRKVHKKKTLDRFHCNTCGEVFKTATKLSRHQQCFHRTPKALALMMAPQHLDKENEEGASSQLVPVLPVPVAASSSNNPQLPRRSTRKRNILDRSKNPAEFYQHGEMRRSKMYIVGDTIKRRRRSKMSYDHVNILGENPPLYQCKVCQKKFTGKTTIYYHKYCQSEDADKPFQCGQCRKGFVHRHGFEYHLGTHTAERPFVCVVCKRGFIRKSDLQRHIKTHRQAV